ncbi:MAG: ABC transporter substrate-binding protein [Arenicellales bacterium WSBS_2016_MAG_OTU3]
MQTFIQNIATVIALSFALGVAGPATAADDDTLTIAYNVTLPSWDPTVGLSAVNPSIQSIYKSVFDQYIDQNPDLSFKSGLLTEWGWSDDKSSIWMSVRENAFWHDGSAVTPEDVVWSLQRAGNPDTGNPIQFIWGKIGEMSVDGNQITAQMKEYEPALFPWMAFLTGYILPKKYFEKVGAEEFENAPIGSGPYMLDAFERGGFVRLKRFDKYWGDKPEFETVVFKFVTDASSRVAEIESGSSDITLEVPYEQFDRLRKTEGIKGISTPVSDIGMIFLNDIEIMQDANVRKAAAHAINKEAIVKHLLRGYGVPIDTLQAPQYMAFDDSTKVAYDPDLAMDYLAKSGYSKDKPAKFKIQTTRGFKPKDYEMIQAVVGMWRKVGIEAEIEVYEIAKHYELRATDTLAPAAFYNWGNSIGDPSTSTGFAMFGPSPHSTWDTDDLDNMIAPLWGEADEAKRIDGYKKVDKYIAENAYVIPLLQYVQPILHRDDIKVTPHVANFVLPQLVGK